MLRNQNGTQINISSANDSWLSDTIADNDKSGIKLIKFDTLDDNSRFNLTSSKDKSSETVCHIKSDENYKQPQSLDHEIYQTLLTKLRDIVPYNGGSVDKQTSSCVLQEHFTIIWRQLSFQVDLSLYDRVVNLLNESFKGTSKNQELDQQHNNHNAIDSQDDLVKSSIGSEKLVKKVSTKRTIFKDLNGFIKSGEISAILGPSGAGKTSLLNAIRGKVENYRGEIQLIGGGSRKMRLSIIPQKDYLIDNLTVKETLLYSSKILNTEKEFDHGTHILKIVRMLNLADCFESNVSNISGGEYKRVSIAQELLKQPDLLILDEPTSGLDSLNCKNLIKSLSKLIDASREGSISPIAIVITIHQPDVEVFHMFDHIYCMARKGRVIYDGHPNDVMEVLSSQLKGSPMYEEAMRSAQNFAVNPATLLIEIASENIYGQELIEKLAEYQRTKIQLEIDGKDCGNKQSPRKFYELSLASLSSFGISPGLSPNITLNESESKINLNKNLTTCSASSSYNSLDQRLEVAQLIRDKRLNSKKDNNGKFWYHTKILTQRTFRSTIRDPLMTTVSLLFHLIIPFVMWVIYSKKIGYSNACPIIQNDVDLVSLISEEIYGTFNSMRDELNYSLECTIMLFLTVYTFSLSSIGVTAMGIPLSMNILLKEVRNGWYNLPSFVVAKTLANFPFEVLFPVISFMLCYILLGLPPSYLQWRLWAMALVMALVSIISHTHGLIFGAIFMDSIETVIFLSTAVTFPLVLLSGFTARIKNIPELLQHLSWISLYRYAVDALNIIRFGFGICPCDDSTINYLKTSEPDFLDIPHSVRTLLDYYLTSNPQDTLTTPETDISTFSPIFDFSNVTNSSFADIMIQPLGISNKLTISQVDRSQLLSNIGINQIDSLKKLAKLVVKSFAYGREFSDCSSIRAEVLLILGTPKDSYLLYIFLGMIMLLIIYKILLFTVVRYRIGSRI